MKRTLQIAGLLLVLILAGLFIFQKFVVSEEAKISKQLDGLVKAFEKTGEESIIITASRAKKVLTFFAPEFVAEPGPPFPQVDNEQEFVSLIAGFRSSTASLRISTQKRDIRTRNNDADVLTTMRADYRGMGERGTEIRTFQITMKQIDGIWLISRVQLVDE